MPKLKYIYVVRIGKSPTEKDEVRVTTVAATQYPRIASAIARAYRRLIGGTWAKHRFLAYPTGHAVPMRTKRQLLDETFCRVNYLEGTHAFWDSWLWTCAINVVPLTNRVLPSAGGGGNV